MLHGIYLELCDDSILREVGPRSKVWTEKEMLEISAWEFAEVRFTYKRVLVRDVISNLFLCY